MLLAKIQQQAEFASTLAAVLMSKGVITQETFLELRERLRDSQSSLQARKALQALQDFEASHNILKRYEEPEE